MLKRVLGLVAALWLALAARYLAADEERAAVVLLHGLARSSASMERMARALAGAGYRVCNLDYPSTRHRVARLARQHVLPRIRRCGGGPRRHFVTHSMGGIVLRYLAHGGMLAEAGIRLGRVVMLSPPNRGSEVVDMLGESWAFGYINGPAGRELGTGPQGLARRLGPATFELGVITGRCSINPVLSLIIPGDDDGKVSIERARLDGMKDFLVLPATHTFIMQDDAAIAQTLYFLRHGRFDPWRPGG